MENLKLVSMHLLIPLPKRGAVRWRASSQKRNDADHGKTCGHNTTIQKLEAHLLSTEEDQATTDEAAKVPPMVDFLPEDDLPHKEHTPLCDEALLGMVALHLVERGPLKIQNGHVHANQPVAARGSTYTIDAKRIAHKITQDARTEEKKSEGDGRVALLHARPHRALEIQVHEDVERTCRAERL